MGLEVEEEQLSFNRRMALTGESWFIVLFLCSTLAFCVVSTTVLIRNGETSANVKSGRKTLKMRPKMFDGLELVDQSPEKSNL